MRSRLRLGLRGRSGNEERTRDWYSPLAPLILSTLADACIRPHVFPDLHDDEDDDDDDDDDMSGLLSMGECLQLGSLQDVNAEEQMDPILWSKLSDDFLDLILACLPIASILRMRAVSKKWKGIISSASFLKAHARLSPKKPYFLMFSQCFRGSLSAVYDLQLNKWQLIPLSNFVDCEQQEHIIMAASDGGLICLFKGLQAQSIFVSNPITKCHRKLPPMLPMKYPHAVAMVVDRIRGEYKILLVAQDGDRISSQLYDSISNSWKMTGFLILSTGILSRAAFHNGLLYFIDFRINCVCAFDMELGIWHEANLTMPASISCRYLFQKRGELMMIGCKEELGSLKSVHFWRLLSDTKRWDEVQTVPDALFQAFFESRHFICVGHDDHVCFYNFDNPDLLMYNAVEEAWSWISRRSIEGRFEVQCVPAVSFEPSLHITAV